MKYEGDLTRTADPAGVIAELEVARPPIKKLLLRHWSTEPALSSIPLGYSGKATNRHYFDFSKGKVICEVHHRKQHERGGKQCGNKPAAGHGVNRK
jgi:hypothetical protein